MKVYVLTTNDGGDNEIFCGVISDPILIKESYYTIYEVEVDSPFDKIIAFNVPAQTFRVERE